MERKLVILLTPKMIIMIPLAIKLGAKKDSIIRQREGTYGIKSPELGSNLATK